VTPARAPSQLPLSLGHEPHYGRDSFVAGPSNRTALALIERWPAWPAPVLVLTGPPGSGKTHLAHIWAERTGAEIVRAAELRAHAPRGESGLVVEDVAMDAVPEQLMFHLINAAKEAAGSLLITSRFPAAHWRVALPDLRSRLRMAAPAALGPPDDELLRTVLVKLFADRQLTVDRAVIDFLLVRMERSLSAALLLVEALDREALAAGRAITRPLAARIIAETTDATGEFTETQ
jgi:chromosomal replication initiation ATPase DnaA